jgi:hypothetical protein
MGLSNAELDDHIFAFTQEAQNLVTILDTMDAEDDEQNVYVPRPKEDGTAFDWLYAIVISASDGNRLFTTPFMTEAISMDDAVAKGYSIALQIWKPSEGWQNHNVLASNQFYDTPWEPVDE